MRSFERRAGNYSQRFLRGEFKKSYSTGMLDEINFNTSDLNIVLLELRANKGDSKAQLELAECYLNPLHNLYAPNKAFAWLKSIINSSLNENDPIKAQAYYFIGLCYWKEYGVQKDIDKAIDFLDKAAKKNLPEASRELGWLFSEGNKRGLNISEDKGNSYTCYKKAKEKYQERANTGDTDAEYNLGRMFQRGLGCPRDNNKAFDYYRKAANKDHVYATTNLAWLYLDRARSGRSRGQKVQDDYNEAITLFEKCCEVDPVALLNLGVMYLKGYGVEPTKINRSKSIEYLGKAAKHWPLITDYTNVLSRDEKYALGYICFYGIGVSKNIQMAEEWLKKADNEGDKDATFLLGKLYEFYHRNLEDAKTCYRRAEDTNPLAAGYLQQCESEQLDNFFSQESKTNRLHALAAMGKKDELRQLISEISRCADGSNDGLGKLIDSRSASLKTPIHFAISGQHFDIVKMLIKEFHASPIAQDEEGNTALHHAVNIGNVEITKYILEKYANECLLIRNELGETALDIAYNNREENPEIFDLFRDVISNGKSILEIAIIRGDARTIEKLDKYGILSELIDKRTADGMTPLQLAVDSAQYDCVVALLDKKINIMACNRQYQTAIDIAANKGLRLILSLLFSHREQLNESYLREKIKICVEKYIGSYANSESDTILLDDCVSQLVHTDISKLKETTSWAKYIAQWRSSSGIIEQNGVVENLENWKPEEFIALTIDYLFELIVRIQKGKIGEDELPDGYTRESAVNILTKELCTEIEILRNRRDVLIAHSEKYLYDDKLKKSIANNMIDKIKRLSPGQEYCYNAGHLEHSNYISLFNNVNSITMVVSDFSQGGVKRNLPAEEDGTYYPYAKQLPVNQNGDYNDLNEYTNDVINHRFNSEKAAYSKIFKFGKPDVDESKKYSPHRMQSRRNCVVENFKVRLEKNLSLPLFEFVEKFLLARSVTPVRKLSATNDPLQISKHRSTPSLESDKLMYLEGCNGSTTSDSIIGRSTACFFQSENNIEKGVQTAPVLRYGRA